MKRRQLAAREPAVRPEEQMDALRKAFSAAHPGAAIETIERAYTVAAHAHRGQLRKSGDPYIIHPIAVAMIVTEFGMSPEVVYAALLHDTVNDKAANTCTLSQLRDDFGEESAALVNEVSRPDDPKHAEEKLGCAEAAIRSNPDGASDRAVPEFEDRREVADVSAPEGGGPTRSNCSATAFAAGTARYEVQSWWRAS